MKAGTSVTLRCLITNCLEEPAYVFWYHGDRRLLDDKDRMAALTEMENEAQRRRRKFQFLTTSPSPLGSGGDKRDRKKSGRKSKSRKRLLKEINNNGTEVEKDMEWLYERGGIRINTKRLVSDGSAVSTVTIENPTPAHSGTFTCSPAHLEPAHVNLHVIQGNFICVGV